MAVSVGPRPFRTLAKIAPGAVLSGTDQVEFLFRRIHGVGIGEVIAHEAKLIAGISLLVAADCHIARELGPFAFDESAAGEVIRNPFVKYVLRPKKSILAVLR